jgi:protein involved in polysaccharide export with SLBB domain
LALAPAYSNVNQNFISKNYQSKKILGTDVAKLCMIMIKTCVMNKRRATIDSFIKGSVFLVMMLVAIITAQAQYQQNNSYGNAGSGSDADLMDQFNSMDVTQIDVQNLSDAQISRLSEAMEQRGVSIEQVELVLRQRGMSDYQVNLLKQRLNNVGSSSARGSSSSMSQNPSRKRQEPIDEDQELGDYLDRDVTDYILTTEEEAIFGYKLFNNPELTFEPSMNIATPKDYRVGPGDEVFVDVWGAAEANFMVEVTPEGYVILQNVGPVYINGLTVAEAELRIKNKLSNIFSGMRGSRPNTFAQVNLGNVRSIKVNIVGEVRRPGTYTISSLASAFNALYLAGGPSVNGSFRDIQLIRNDEVVANIDIYRFLVDGEQVSNLRLEDQDIIRVGPFLNRVSINGEVKRDENIYEMLNEESLQDLVRYAGGFTDKAYTHALKVRRNTSRARRIYDVQKPNFEDFNLKAGDVVNVEAILNRFENRVQISGAVFREGEFQLDDGLTVKKLIEKAEGLRGDAFMERATIYRTKEDFTTEIIPFNLLELLKNEAKDIPLRREDLVKISSLHDLNEEYYVQIDGEVQTTGIFPFMYSMTIEDLILEAGGMLESASNSHVEVVRRYKPETTDQFESKIAEIFTFDISNNLSMEEADLRFTLKPFDMVFVRRSPGYEMQQTVKVEGEVKYPGLYGIEKKNERISDLLARTGGLTPEAYPSGATLIRRTEYFKRKTEEEFRQQKNQELKVRNQIMAKRRAGMDLTEAEEARLARMENETLTGANGQSPEETFSNNSAAELRKQRLEELGERDAIDAGANSQQESIGINLKKILANPDSKHDLILQEGDVLNIPRELQTVRMRGEFLYPITTRYDDNFGFMHYVSSAGGFNDQAKKNKAYVIYANGSVDRTRNFLFLKFYPKVDPGAEIVVPRKPERTPLSPTAWIGISTGAASFALILSQLITSLDDGK